MMRQRHWALAALAVPLLIVAAACTTEDSTTGEENAVTSIPWTAPESYRYVIVNEDNEQQGEGVLSVTEDPDGNFELLQSFSDEDGNRDQSVLIVDADSLQPIAGERTIVDADDDRRVNLRTSYEDLNEDELGVRIAQLSFDPADEEEPDDTRCSPLGIDEEFYYDYDASLFLWRTLNFEEGYSVTYTNVIAGRRDKRAITVRVRRQEEIETPGGTFNTWLVGIEGEGRETQSAWFATTPDHKLIAYNNQEGQVFLYAGEPEQPDPGPPAELPEECQG